MPDFGLVERVEPEAIGEPGKRTFRLRVLSGRRSAALYLEKEQLAALTLAMRQLLEQTAPADKPDEEDVPQAASDFPERPQLEFKIGRLGIGYDERRRLAVIYAYEQDEPEDAPEAFACQLTRGQCRSFAERAEEVIAAGRPVCVLCGGPIEHGRHQCQRRNGHSAHPISLDDREHD
jgi:uncharacterized repeat protein (TIGR03847 family)